MVLPDNGIVFSIFLIFAGSAVLATLALIARQAMIVAYILLGVVLGPWGLALVDDAAWINDVSDIGMMFLLYLLGLNLMPSRLVRSFKRAVGVTCVSSAIFLSSGFFIAIAFSFNFESALLIGTIMMFSSTIIGLKLLPTTTLHHKHTGEVIISVLLLQDLVAIIVLIVLQGVGGVGELWLDVARGLGALPALILVAYLAERYMIEPLITRYHQIPEYIFLLVIAWCLGVAELAYRMHLSHAIGAFIAGVSLASCPIAPFIADRLRPLRDFFLVLFFFSLGAKFNLAIVGEIFYPAATLATAMLVLKPFVFRQLLVYTGEKRVVATEIGVRLGQGSEFALLIAVLALGLDLSDGVVANVIQFASLLTFVGSAYLVVLQYPTPIATTDRLRRD